MLENRILERVLIDLREGVEFTKNEIENIITNTRAEIDRFDQEYCDNNKHYCEVVAQTYAYALLHSIKYK